MPRRKLSYKEGTWFGVPLHDGGYSVGLVARADGRGSILGYFFGSEQRNLITLDDVTAFGPEDAVLVTVFGDLGLLKGVWPIIGQAKDWSRSDWPMPLFGRTVPHPTKHEIGYVTQYDEESAY